MSGSSYTYTLSPIAYALPILHAAGHPSSSVQGVFLANTSTSTATTGSGRRPLELEEAIPLLHAETTLTPMLEAGLEHVEVYAGKKGLTIVGMYEITEGVALSLSGKGLLGGLKKDGNEAFALTVDITKLRSGGNPYIMTLASDPSKTVPTASAPLSLPNPEASKQMLRLIREDKAHELLRDWDDHLDDSSVEWLENKKVKDAILKRVTA